MKSGRWTQTVRICDKLVMAMLYVLMADCAVFGAGRTIAIGSIGFRTILAGLIVLVSVPLIIRNYLPILRNRYTWFLAAFLCWAAINAVRGFVVGNTMAVLLADVKGFIYLLLFFPVFCVLNSKERIHRLMKVVLYASLVLGVATVLFLVAYNLLPELYLKFYFFDNEYNIAMWSALTARTPRLFFKSSPYFLCSCVFSVYFCVLESKEKIKKRYPLVVGVSLFGLLMSYTRSIYLAAAVSAVILVFVLAVYAVKRGNRTAWKCIGLSVAAFCCITLLLSVCMKENYVGHAINRMGLSFYVSPDYGNPSDTQTDSSESTQDTKPDATQPTDDYHQDTINSDLRRKQTLQEVRSYIADSPWIGNGLGKSLICRNNGSHEYFFEDLIMKMGVIGLILYLAPILYIICSLLAHRGLEESFLLRGSWVAILIGFCAFSYFNPYMNASLGISLLCCTMGVFAKTDNKEKMEDRK